MESEECFEEAIVLSKMYLHEFHTFERGFAGTLRKPSLRVMHFFLAVYMPRTEGSGGFRVQGLGRV